MGFRYRLSAVGKVKRGETGPEQVTHNQSGGLAWTPALGELGAAAPGPAGGCPAQRRGQGCWASARSFVWSFTPNKSITVCETELQETGTEQRHRTPENKQTDFHPLSKAPL